MEKVIVGHPDYTVTDCGKIISYKGRSPRILIPDYNNGYPRVTIDGERKYIANIVAETFLGTPETPDSVVFYIDGHKDNCCVDNIAWLTPSEVQLFSQYTIEYRRQVLESRA